MRGPIPLVLSCQGTLPLVYSRSSGGLSLNPPEPMVNTKYIIPDACFCLWALNPPEKS